MGSFSNSYTSSICTKNTPYFIATVTRFFVDETNIYIYIK